MSIVKLIKFDDAKAKKAHSGHPYIQVDGKKHSLMDAEEKQLRDALAKTFPLLTDDEINKLLGIDS